jgi:hypothetical protein
MKTYLARLARADNSHADFDVEERSNVAVATFASPSRPLR